MTEQEREEEIREILDRICGAAGGEIHEADVYYKTAVQALVDLTAAPAAAPKDTVTIPIALAAEIRLFETLAARGFVFLLPDGYAEAANAAPGTDRDRVMEILDGMASRGNPAVERRADGAFVVGAPFGGNSADINSVYTERTRLVALLASLCRSLGYAAGLGQHDPEDKAWDPAWRTIVFVDIPTGDVGTFQASWHIADRDREFVAHLPPYPGVWDGHTTAIKYGRMDRAAQVLADEEPTFTPPTNVEHLALRNCLALARKHLAHPTTANGDWNDIVRFCASAGVVPTILRGTWTDKAQQIGAEAIQQMGQGVLELLADMVEWGSEGDGVPDFCLAFWQVMEAMGGGTMGKTPAVVQEIIRQRSEARRRQRVERRASDGAYVVLGAENVKIKIDELADRIICVNPEAIGDPDQVPLVKVPQALAEMLRENGRDRKPYEPPTVTTTDGCATCRGTGVIETGNNDQPCDCPAGDVAVFNVAGLGQITGAQIKRER